jgi:hypothetical protein
MLNIYARSIAKENEDNYPQYIFFKKIIFSDLDIDEFCFAHQDRKIHSSSHFHALGIIDKTSINYSCTSFGQGKCCVLDYGIICWDGE